ncbi:P-loop containing nucleoside triphosphate hydrolase protein [Lipomyces tetrasporus]|uniref:P-loop containing nucleoside triphosphate hydrolase protein n=1 Tax=Lipomyces tetrasporus TaxID=54092 RepID=A0AAD7QTA8_9ASCO|nr:P-loop containing nucleoside triphosphate hydrolase protein [Lipomyces tetrasporus]KAJ8100951.1 P-loop containing nucleoside triphosphate hydrolase protein [Lipomyces tetrasporus]
MVKKSSSSKSKKSQTRRWPVDAQVEVEVFVVGSPGIGRYTWIWKWGYNQNLPEFIRNQVANRFQHLPTRKIEIDSDRVSVTVLYNLYFEIKDEGILPRYLLDEFNVYIFCFSVADRASFRTAERYWERLKLEHPSGFVTVLVGLKADLRTDPDTLAALEERNEKVISPEEGQRLASKMGTKYFECSAINFEGIHEPISEVVSLALATNKVKAINTGKDGCCSII